MRQTPLLYLQHGPPSKITEVAFTKPSITDNWERAVAEGDFGRAKRTREVRAENNREVIVMAPGAEMTRLLLASR